MKNFSGKILSYIEDRSGVLSSDSLRKYNKKFSLYENKNSVKVLSIFLPDIFLKDINKIGLQILNKNLLGEKNIGIILLVGTESKNIKILSSIGAEKTFSKEFQKNTERKLNFLLKKRDYEEILKKWFDSLENFGKEDIKNNDNLLEKKELKNFLYGIIFISLITFIFLFLMKDLFYF